MTERVDLAAADDPVDVVRRAAELVADGEVVVIPTSIGSLAVAAPDRGPAVQRLLANSGDADALLLVLSAAQAAQLVPGMNEDARRVARRFWPGSLIVVVTARRKLPDGRELTDDDTGPIRLACPQGRFVEVFSRLVRYPLLAARVGGDASAVAPALLVEDSGLKPASPTVVSCEESRWHIVEPGVLDGELDRAMQTRNVLFVCTGNTCRSPMAAAVFRKILADRLGCSVDDLARNGFCVESAGVAAGHGSPASADAVEVVAERGASLLGHRSQPLDESLVRGADWIFAMTADHLHAVRDYFPEAADRLELLAREADVVDPIGRGLDEYRRCCDMIESHLRRIARTCTGG